MTATNLARNTVQFDQFTTPVKLKYKKLIEFLNNELDIKFIIKYLAVQKFP